MRCWKMSEDAEQGDHEEVCGGLNAITRRERPAVYLISPQDMEALQRTHGTPGEDRGQRERAAACAQAWNVVECELGSFADEHLLQVHLQKDHAD